MSLKKKRADKALVERGLVSTRQKALRYILAGQVYSLEKRIDKPGQLLSEEEACSLRIREKDPYVSRASHKLLGAFHAFSLDVREKIAMDIGASTGGFTQVLLEKGALRVYAIDVGYGQLDHSLREDPRVIVLERQNMRHLPKEMVPEPVEFFTMDVSFISSRILLNSLKPFLTEDARGVLLIKPQFEAGRGSAPKGVVHDMSVHRDVLENMMRYFHQENWGCLGLEISPVKGAKGNIEYLAHLALGADTQISLCSIERVLEKVDDA